MEGLDRYAEASAMLGGCLTLERVGCLLRWEKYSSKDSLNVQTKSEDSRTSCILQHDLAKLPSRDFDAFASLKLEYVLPFFTNRQSLEEDSCHE